MKLFCTTKDGGKKSRVWAHWVIEFKGLFSIVLLRFEDGSREAFHNHAFNCFSWVVKGKLYEEFCSSKRIGEELSGTCIEHRASIKPFCTYKDDFHKVSSVGRSWVVSFRGPWSPTWKEIDEKGNQILLTHGRKVISNVRDI